MGPSPGVFLKPPDTQPPTGAAGGSTGHRQDAPGWPPYPGDVPRLSRARAGPRGVGVAWGKARKPAAGVEEQELLPKS